MTLRKIIVISINNIQSMKYIKVFILVLGFITIFIIPLFSYSSDSLVYSVSYLKNTQSNLDPEEVLNGNYDQEFVLLSLAEYNLERNEIWLKIDINNASQHSDWALKLGDNEKIIAYYRGEKKQTGTHCSINDKDLATHENAIRLLIEPGLDQVLYLQIANAISSADTQMRFIDYMKWKLDSISSRSKVNLEIGVFEGIMFIISLFILTVYFKSKDKTYLYYALYLILAGLYVLGINDYYWYVAGSFSSLFPYFKNVILAGVYIFYFQFIRYYFDTKQNYPIWNKVFIIINYQFIATAMVKSFYPSFSFYSSFIFLSIILLTLIFFGALFLKKDTLAKFVVLGSIVFFICLFTAILLDSLNIIGIEWANSLVMFGIIIQILLFSLGLLYRYRLHSKQKKAIHVKYIEQLKKNEEIQKHINQNLKSEVSLRTEKIFRQKEELIKKADELYEIHSELQSINVVLEDRVNSRIKSIQNQNNKLIDYAFKNEQTVKGPLSHLMRLINKFISADNKEEGKKYIDQINESALELDNTIKEVNELLVFDEVLPYQK